MPAVKYVEFARYLGTYTESRKTKLREEASDGMGEGRRGGEADRQMFFGLGWLAGLCVRV